MNPSRPVPRRTFGFARRNRLRSSASIRVVQGSGRRRAGACLVVCVTHSQEGPPRMALAVSRKVGNAVVRNRVKRRLREVFRHLLPALSPVDVVLIARAPAAGASLSVLRTEAEGSLRSLGAFAGDASGEIG